MGFDEIEGKMIGLVGVSGGSLGAVHALSSLRSVGRALHSWVVPEQASNPQVRKAFDDSGRRRDAGLEERVKEVDRQVARFAYLHRGAGEGVPAGLGGAPLNPGGASEWGWRSAL
jgi:NAD(P)H-dependent FMN reductase